MDLCLYLYVYTGFVHYVWCIKSQVMFNGDVKDTNFFVAA